MMTTALYWGVPLPALERRRQAVCDPRRFIGMKNREDIITFLRTLQELGT
jgi:hypothetical protein